MPSSYPGALDSLPTINANGDTSENLHPELHNDANSAINAIQGALGTDPQGPEATVAARLAAIEAALGGGGTSTFAVFTASSNQPPASAFATLDSRNSMLVLDFDAAAVESAGFVGRVPQGAVLTSGIKVRLDWMATSATSGNVVWRAEFERGTTDVDSNSFDTATDATAATSGTSGTAVTTEITCTTIDSIVAGDRFRIRISRVGTSGSDTMSGDAELVSVELRAA